MEQVLDTYTFPHDSKITIIVMNEHLIQIFKETCKPISASRNHVKQVDYEYECVGVANIFMFTVPLACWRRVSVRKHKTMID